MRLRVQHIGFSSLLLLAISLSAWSIWVSLGFHRITHPLNQQEPDAYVENIHVVEYNKAGYPSLILNAPKVWHYAAKDSSRVIAPDITVFRDSKEPWHIHADTAATREGLAQIQFQHHVKILHEADSDHPHTTVETDTLNVYPLQNIASTQDAILFTQPDTTIHAIGMLANLDEGTIQLLSAAQGEYAPQS